MTRRTVKRTKVTMTVGIDDSATVEYVSIVARYASIRFSNGLQLELNREQLESIAAGISEQDRINRILASLDESIKPAPIREQSKWHTPEH